MKASNRKELLATGISRADTWVRPYEMKNYLFERGVKIEGEGEKALSLG